MSASSADSSFSTALDLDGSLHLLVVAVVVVVVIIVVVVVVVVVVVLGLLVSFAVVA